MSSSRSCLLMVFSLVSQTTTLADDWSIGSFKLSAAPAPALVMKEPLKTQLGDKPNHLYLLGCGGVAFDAIARPEGAPPTSLKINYSKEAADGRRLFLLIDGKRSIVTLHDWQLIPIARYADTDLSAAFTLFGKLEDQTMERQILRDGGRILNYAPPFKNTLLGLRLFQLDVLIIHKDFSIELPKRGQEYVLGAAESPPDLASGEQARNAYFMALALMLGTLEDAYQSYVISDYGQDIVFKVIDGHLEITGDLFYYFWKSTYDDIEDATRLAVAKSMQILADGGGLDDLKRLLATLPSNKVDEFHLEVKRRISTDGQGLKYVYLKEYSAKRNKLNVVLRAMNPAVWESGQNVLRYAAFFRYVKATFPNAWREFITEVSTVSPAPEIETPGIMAYKTPEQEELHR